MPEVRVAQILEATTGGARKHFTDLVTQLHGPEFRMGAIVATRRDRGFLSDIDRMRALGVEVCVVDMVRQISPGADWRAYRSLRALLAEGQFDVVHAHSAKAGALGRYAAAGLRPRPGIVYTPHCFPFQMDVPRRQRRLYAAIERRLARVTDRIICVSEAEREAALSHGLCPPERLVMIPNGLDVAAFDRAAAADVERRELGLDQDDVVVGTVGRLEAQKGHTHVLAAVALVVRERPDVRLLIVGDGELGPALARQAEEGGIAEQVVFLGRYEPAAALYQLMDIYVLPSLWEGAPYSLPEAMAAGLPVVCTDVGGCRDIVVEGGTGLLVPPAEPRALADSVLQLLREPERAGAMGRAGRRRVEERLSLERMLSATANLYREIASARGST